MRKQLEDSEAKVDDLQTKVTGLTTSLSESKTEIKALTMKLSAARSAEAAAVSKVPGSAIKGGAAIKAANNQQVAVSAQMKEDLYGDLTGLIVRGIKREGGEDIYDCIQTGRNGSKYLPHINAFLLFMEKRNETNGVLLALHFKLAICNDPSSDDYDEAQFLYMPQLDPNRDRALIEMLPDYLVEEITFPRPHANKFYARVMKALTE